MPAQLGPGYRSPQYHLQEERRVGFCRFQKPEGQLYIVYNSIVLCFFFIKNLGFCSDYHFITKYQLIGKSAANQKTENSFLKIEFSFV